MTDNARKPADRMRHTPGGTAITPNPVPFQVTGYSFGPPTAPNDQTTTAATRRILLNTEQTSILTRLIQINSLEWCDL